jgi:hypothetical protein
MSRWLGFERNREAELIITAGNFFQTDDQLNFGDHTEKFAYYASLNGNRSDYGLAPPVGQVVHDATNGYGGWSASSARPPTDDRALLRAAQAKVQRPENGVFYSKFPLCQFGRCTIRLRQCKVVPCNDKNGSGTEIILRR